MNKIVIKIIDIIMFLTIRLFVWDRIKYNEIKSKRYDNDEAYFQEINNIDVANILHDQANSRIELIQTKLSSLLSILSILIGIYSITGVITTKYPILIQLLCVFLSFLGIIYIIGPLTVTSLCVLELANYKKRFTKEIKKEYLDVITDLGCKADFHADCLKTAKTLIIFSMFIYIIGIIMSLSAPDTASINQNKLLNTSTQKNILPKQKAPILFPDKAYLY
jgi:hypothetical protein